MMICPLQCYSQVEKVNKPVRNRSGVHQPVSTATDSTAMVQTGAYERQPVLDAQGDTVKFTAADSVILAQAKFAPDTAAATHLGKLRVFNPDPKRAMWLSALCPGLGQVYNRRYWKIPIVVGAFVGLGYGTAWNNRMPGDYTNQLRQGGLSRHDALVAAGQTRMRPILMTSITTILGLIVMALGIGTGTEMMQPIAIVCIGGLVYATALTLFVVPVIYDMMNKKELRKVAEEELVELQN